MLEMSIRQFAHLIDGKPELSETPPLAGMNEPIGRVVPMQASYAVGDVVLVEEQETTCVEALQLQGAMGVVSTRQFAPLAGCFSVCVADVKSALQRVAEYCRDRYLGRLLVTIVPEGCCDDLLWQLVNINQAAPLCKIELGVGAVSQLSWCDADQVLIDSRLSDSQRSFVVTYLPTNAPIRLAG
jgi:hypothetical protein